jgi:hypothetical protein
VWKSNILQSLTYLFLKNIFNISPWRSFIHLMLDLLKDSRAVILLAGCNWRCLVFALDCITWASRAKSTVSSEVSVASRSSQTVRPPGIWHLVSGTAKRSEMEFLTSSRRRHRQIEPRESISAQSRQQRNRCVKNTSKKTNP